MPRASTSVRAVISPSPSPTSPLGAVAVVCAGAVAFVCPGPVAVAVAAGRRVAARADDEVGTVAPHELDRTPVVELGAEALGLLGELQGDVARRDLGVRRESWSPAWWGRG